MTPALKTLRQIEINWFLERHVTSRAIILPTPIMRARGLRAGDGIFEPMDEGPVWFAFPVEIDVVFWRPRTGEIAVDKGRAFALGQDLIDNPGVTALDQWLRIFASPLEWLQASRNGLYILPDRWPWCFEMLRDVARIAVAADVLPLYRRHMKPRLPQLAVLPKAEACAA